MIRDNGPGVLLLPVKMMKTRGPLAVDVFAPLHKARDPASVGRTSAESVAAGKAVTVLTYLHGTKESEDAIEVLEAEGYGVDLIELTCLKPFDKETVEASLKRTHKLAMLDESTRSGGVGATMSALINETLFDELDAPVKRLCMEDAPVPYATEDGEGDGEARLRPHRRARCKKPQCAEDNEERRKTTTAGGERGGVQRERLTFSVVFCNTR